MYTSELVVEKYSSKNVKKSKEVTEKLGQYNIEEDERLVSFDVVSLFPSVPVDKSIELLKDWLTDNKVSEERIREYLELVNIVVRQTAFSFNDMIFQQTQGLAKGNPISPFLADIFMSNLEVKVVQNFPHIHRLWNRYVDDVLSVLKEKYLNEALQILNKQDDSVKFTIEIEIEGELPFLDLLIQRTDNQLNVSIYRKPTSSEVYITGKNDHLKNR